MNLKSLSGNYVYSKIRPHSSRHSFTATITNSYTDTYLYETSSAAGSTKENNNLCLVRVNEEKAVSLFGF